MRRGQRKLLVIALISGTMFPLGCVRRHVEGDTTTYATEPWVIAVMALASVSTAVVGWYVRRKRKSRHFSPNPTASGSKKGLDLRREGGNYPLQRLRPSVGRSERASLTIDYPRLTPKS